ncbi:uncharacterized protein TA15540 [Theileria annulata]|uniref:Uncharacterized protein n=1 Tax=Theileria annulata TaxID=5874 RepID=Q4UFJ7_THEAN|nr:uncharacterized protein TA15540 [Theileria annulata]CAI74119.1 hypothetical protein TA15540 [Theileria annulata]|eukprot:XP_951851.1 hypothetical protein TA15540 [Theileria annulata]
MFKCLKKYYKYDLISCIIFSIILLYYLIFCDQTKSIDLLTNKIIFLHYFINPIKIFFYLIILPIITFNSSVTVTGPTASTAVTGINNITTVTKDISVSSTVRASTVTGIWNYKTILKYEFNKKLKILIKFNGILVFLTIILTTNNSLNYLLNYIISCFLYTCISLGTFIHFFFLPNSVTVTGPPNSTTNSTKDSTKGTKYITLGKGVNDTFDTPGKGANSTLMECTMGKGANSMVTECTTGKGANFTAMECITGNTVDGEDDEDTSVVVGPNSVLEKLIIIKFIMLLIGNCFGNYLLLLDWYQLFARFPITNFIGLTIGHFLSSLISNFILLK